MWLSGFWWCFFAGIECFPTFAIKHVNAKLLKNMGKIVVIVSHDDKYFDIADQLIRMEDGQLINLSNTMPDMEPEAVS